MDPQDLRHLCDVHMEVLKDELYKVKSKVKPGHVLDTLIAEHEKLKEFLTELEQINFDDFKQNVDASAKYIVFNLRDHIYKENYILYPTALDALQEKELWGDMKNRCDQIGYCGFTPKN